MKNLINNLMNKNRVMEEEINSIKNNQSIIINKINFSQGFYEIDEKYFNTIRNWIDSSGKYKITFDLVYTYNIFSSSQFDQFRNNCHINGPAVFIFVT